MPNAATQKPNSNKEVPYPEKPYAYSHTATYPSGFKRNLVTYGAKCQECKSSQTFLDGGRPACVEHLDRLCKHGLGGCNACGRAKCGPIRVRKIQDFVLEKRYTK